MAFPYKHVLIVGATSGIGKAMADKLIASGVKVTVVGRRKDRLDEFVKQHGQDKASSIVLDIVDQEAIPAFARDAMQKHPDIDCIFLNAGIQHMYDFSKPESLDLARYHREITTNFSSFVSLTHAFLPYLLKTEEKRGIIFTGTHISLVPAFPMSAYSASKAALDAFIMCLGEQLRDTNVKVTHISPPPVQTEIHDAEMGSEAGRRFGMPVEQFTEETYAELVAGNDNIFVGTIGASSREQFLEIAEKRKEAFDRLSSLFRKMMGAKH